MLKKLLLLVLIILGSYYWFSEPDFISEETQDKKSESFSVHETVSSLSEFGDSIKQWYDFPQSLEAKLDRENFVSLKNIPLILRQSVIATEDRRFYEHGAIDLMGIGRALFSNYQAGDTVEGASTISQQVMKNIFLTDARTWSRKAEEALLATQLEHYYTKDQILEIYLNIVYYGAGAYGISEAADIYFNKTPQELSIGQCALLTGMLQAPSALNPFANYNAAKERQKTVLTIMQKQNLISPEIAEESFQADLELIPPQP